MILGAMSIIIMLIIAIIGILAGSEMACFACD